MLRFRSLASRLTLVLFLALLFNVAAYRDARAQSVTPNRDIDLVLETGLVHYSQTDGRWSSFSVRGDSSITIGQCGCLLSTFATVINQQGRMLPWFPTVFYYSGGSVGAFDFNPRYLDLFFNYGPNPFGLPDGDGGFPDGWGYKARPAGTCGITPLMQALQVVGTDGFGHGVGFTPVVRHGFGPEVKDIINRNLLAGIPTIVAINELSPDGTADHAVLIAGWDNDEQRYRVLDPMDPRESFGAPNLPGVPFKIAPGDPPDAVSSYAKWEARVKGIIEMRPGGVASSVPSFIFGDDPSPIEILMTGPDGRRTGVDPSTGASFEENDRASYWTFGPWADPLGQIAGGTPPRFIAFPDAPAGTYHFTVTGVANGPLELSAETLRGGTRVLLGGFNGTIAAGEVRKYELQFARTGASSVAQVSNFTPHAYAGDDVHARTDAPVLFDASRSFDADGVLATFAWDFGDGSTGTGSRASHAYAVPGDYTVTLTVTDANGATATDSMLVHVILSQRRPVAAASGPYLGFTSGGGNFNLLFDARGSSDPNGDPLTYRWDFGDGSPVETTSVGFADHAYADVGLYTLTVIVNDGIDDSEPATARVEIVTAPSAPPFGAIDGSLTPSCASPGTTVTITMGEFAQFHYWNFAQLGGLPAFPPLRLPLGLSAPDGMMDVRIAGGDREYLPFTATLLSPGRYVARASFVVPDLAPGRYQIGWAEDQSLPLQVPCPAPENRPPLANAGGPYTARLGTPITFDGSASSDPDGEGLDYVWDFGDGTGDEGVEPTHVYAHAGTYIVTLNVFDGESGRRTMAGTRSFAVAMVTEAAGDTIPPATTAAPTPAPGSGGWNVTDVAVTLHAVDNPGGSGVRDVTYATSGAQSGGSTVAGDHAEVSITHDGVTTLEYFATDNAGNQEAPQQLIVRIDRTGPAITGMPAEGCTIWPPNHKGVTLANISASDGLSGLAPGSLAITATSSEPVDGRGDGHTAPDVVVTGGLVTLRAERAGTGAGRTYTITATATDLAGNITRKTSSCVVPHDRRPGK